MRGIHAFGTRGKGKEDGIPCRGYLYGGYICDSRPYARKSGWDDSDYGLSVIDYDWDGVLGVDLGL